MSNVMNKVMGFFGVENYDEEIEESDFEEERDENEVEPIASSSKKNSKVVNIHTASSAKIVIAKPQDFEEASDICDNLKNRKIVLVNTSGLEPKAAQRLVDFMSGASYALGGEVSEIEKNVYIFSPSNVQVNNEIKSSLSSKGITFNWSK